MTKSRVAGVSARAVRAGMGRSRGWESAGRCDRSVDRRQEFTGMS